MTLHPGSAFEGCERCRIAQFGTRLVAPTGKPIEWQMINLLRFNDEAQIVEEWAQFDYLSLLRQLGAYVTTPSFKRRPH
ncbi:MAG: ester cyclase [Chloroflexota bacterium]